ncbi:MAG: PEP-CTERM sorting domain-containing protein [Planctomycetaceae bacterium]|nr:PEP-CTERM sorting domain-containing protein [Planctomycetaceae bacterium]
MIRQFLRGVFLFAILSSYQADAGLVTVNNVSDNTAWTHPTYGSGTQEYDARSLTFTNCAGLLVSSLQFQVQLTGVYDDSPALDLDGDGTIDWVMSQDDWYAAVGSGNYQPWVDATPLNISVEVTRTGTTVNATWDGTAGTPGVGATPGFDNVSGLTLQSLGFGVNGLVPNNSFTTNQIRFGNLNQTGPSGHGMTFILPESSINVSSTPEPNSLALALLGGIGCLCRRRRNQREQSATKTHQQRSRFQRHQ